jgi:putative drug exporter of the RND superfamily
VPLRPFRELAFALAVGILIDAFVVRSLLAPMLLSMLGRAVEPASATEPPPVIPATRAPEPAALSTEAPPERA